jgi:hypothetical protein
LSNIDYRVDTIKKTIETLTDPRKVGGLEVKAERTRYMLQSTHKNGGQNHDIKTVNRSSEKVAQFKELGTTVRNQNLVQEETEF